MYARENIPKLQDLTDYDIFALDSTTISCSIKLLSWALGKYSKGAVKMHTVINLRGSIPSFILVTHGQYHDSNVLDEIEPTPMSIYAMDKAYVDFAALARIDICAYLLVARIKANYQSPYSITECHTLISVSALAKVDLRELLIPESLSQNQNVKELDLLNFTLEK